MILAYKVFLSDIFNAKMSESDKQKETEQMMKHKDIYDYLTSTESFGVTTHNLKDGQSIGISTGIKMLMREEPNAEQEIFECLQRFYDADFGTFYETEYERAFAPKIWSDRQAYGEYAIESLDDPIYIHYEPCLDYNVVVYLMLER